MRFFTLLALAGAAIAAPELVDRQLSSGSSSSLLSSAVFSATTNLPSLPTITGVDTLSIISVLVTALPPSLLAEATNTAELSSDIAAEFRTETPGWFSSLPTAVKSYLNSVGAAADASVAATATGASSGISGQTNRSTIASPTLSVESTSGSPNSASNTGPSSSQSSGGAAIPTAVIGGGVAGFIGLVGMLAL